MAEPDSARVVAGTWLTPYLAVLRSRVKAQQVYRLSFATEVFSAFLIGLVEFGEVWVIFHNVGTLGGLDVDAALLLFGLSNTSFALAQVAVGHLDSLPSMIRMGTLDAYHLRPQPLLLQLVTSDISLRRLARAAVAVIVLGIGLWRNDIDWGIAPVTLIVITLLSGIALFCGLFVCAAGLQFFLIDGAELTNSFTYGGSFAAMQLGLCVPDTAETVVRVRDSRRVHGVRADHRPTRTAGAAAAARVVGVAHATRRGVGVAARIGGMADRYEALSGRRGIDDGRAREPGPDHRHR